MNYAYVQITKSKIPLIDLAGILGYDSLSHFITLFKKYYGASPSHFRKNNITQPTLQKQLKENE